jgi:hypothetical protein
MHLEDLEPLCLDALAQVSPMERFTFVAQVDRVLAGVADWKALAERERLDVQVALFSAALSWEDRRRVAADVLAGPRNEWSEQWGVGWPGLREDLDEFVGLPLTPEGLASLRRLDARASRRFPWGKAGWVEAATKWLEYRPRLERLRAAALDPRVIANSSATGRWSTDSDTERRLWRRRTRP